MFNNYLKIAVRNFLKYKTYSIINVLGLAVGIATCLLILQYISFERSYDNFHQDSERIYRLRYERISENGEAVEHFEPVNQDNRIAQNPGRIDAVAFHFLGKHEPIIAHHRQHLVGPIHVRRKLFDAGPCHLYPGTMDTGQFDLQITLVVKKYDLPAKQLKILPS